MSKEDKVRLGDLLWNAMREIVRVDDEQALRRLADLATDLPGAREQRCATCQNTRSWHRDHRPRHPFKEQP